MGRQEVGGPSLLASALACVLRQIIPGRRGSFAERHAAGIEATPVVAAGGIRSWADMVLREVRFQLLMPATPSRCLDADQGASRFGFLR